MKNRNSIITKVQRQDLATSMKYVSNNIENTELDSGRFTRYPANTIIFPFPLIRKFIQCCIL